MVCMTSQAEWWKKAVCYQIYPRSFKDSDADGIGDLNGIISKLDYLNDGTEKSLGIDAIWLNPVYPSPQYDFGYDITDITGIDPQYGSMQDFDRLLEEAHKRNIRILMDFVPSVTSHLNPWFIESRSSRRSPKRDWYLWKDPAPGGRVPNKWLGMFGGGAWTWDAKTQQYYFHNSLPEQPDLNWRNPEVEKAMLSCMDFWLKKGVDGFRIDVLNFAFKDELFRDNPACLGRRPYEMQRHIYDRDRPEAVEIGKKMRSLIDRYPDRMLVAEIFVNDPQEAARYYGERQDGVNLVFNFSFAYAPFSAERFRAEVERWEHSTEGKGWPSYFLSNHDMARHASRFARGLQTEARARVAAAMLLTLRGTPFLYMGEEIGMLNGKVKRHELMDPVGVRYWPFNPGRDIARTPVQWNGSDNAGFSDVKPWLPVHPGYPSSNVARQAAQSDSLLAWYRRLIWLRKRSDALSTGAFRSLKDAPAGVFAYTREAEKEKVVVLLNFTPRRKSFSLLASLEANGISGSAWSKAKVLLNWPSADTPEPVDFTHIVLEPYEVEIISID